MHAIQTKAKLNIVNLIQINLELVEKGKYAYSSSSIRKYSKQDNISLYDMADNPTTTRACFDIVQQPTLTVYPLQKGRGHRKYGHTCSGS